MRTRVMVGLALVALVGADLGCGPGGRAISSSAAAEVKRDRWEYARLNFVTNSYPYPNSRYSWAGPDGTRFDEGDIKDFVAKLGLKLKTNDSTAILNALGEDGWDLVTHAATHSRGADGTASIETITTVWTLKRRK